MAHDAGRVDELFEESEKERLQARCKDGATEFLGTGKRAFALLNQFRSDEESGFCDVTIRVEGVDLPAHRCILAANSKLFYRMLNSGMRESQEKVLKLQSVSSKAMRIMLEYFYTRAIVISEEGLEELLDAAMFLMVKQVEEACCRFMRENLDVGNSLTIKYLAEKCGASDLSKMADNFIKENFARVWKESEEFVDLSLEQLSSLILSDEILVGSEDDVYSAVMKWINFDVANRKGFLAQLLSSLRHGSLTEHFIKDRLENEPLIRECLASTRVLEHWIYAKTKKSRAKKQKPQNPYRPSTRVHDVVFILEETPGSYFDCSAYDVTSSECIHLPSFPCPVDCSPRIAVVKESLFVIIGGWSDNSGPVVYSLSWTPHPGNSFRWERKASYSEEREFPAMSVLEKNIYLVGGVSPSNDTPVGVVECYDSLVDSWKTVSPLTEPRSRFVAVSMQNSVFAIGGLVRHDHGQSVTRVVEKYDPSKNVWTCVASLHVGRVSLHAFCLGDKIYVMGGVSNPDQVYSCEVYDVTADEWTLVPNLQEPRKPIYGSYGWVMGAFPLHGVLHVCFQNWDTFKFLELNPKTDRLEKSQYKWPVKSKDENALNGAFLVQVSAYSLKLFPKVSMSDEDFLDDSDWP